LSPKLIYEPSFLLICLVVLTTTPFTTSQAFTDPSGLACFTARTTLSPTPAGFHPCQAVDHFKTLITFHFKAPVLSTIFTILSFISMLELLSTKQI